MFTERFRSTKIELGCDLTQSSPFLHDDYLCQSLRALFFTCGHPQSTDVWYSHIFGVLLQLSPKKNNICHLWDRKPKSFCLQQSFQDIKSGLCSMAATSALLLGQVCFLQMDEGKNCAVDLFLIYWHFHLIVEKFETDKHI